MCYVITDSLKPTDTRLITVRLPAESRKGAARHAYLTLYDNKATVAKRSSRQLMIVPFPNRHKMVEADFKLVEYPSRKAEEHIFEMADATFYKRESRSMTNKSMSLSYETNAMPDSLAVSVAGGYIVTVAPNHADLTTRVQWKNYSLPPNFDDLMKDLKTRFGEDYGFIVAEPRHNGKSNQMGGMFGWVWYGDEAMLPTAHEKMANPKYDVTGWVVNDGLTAMWSQTSQPLTGVTVHERAADELREAMQRAVELGNWFHAGDDTKKTQIKVGELTHAVRVDLHGVWGVNSHVTVPADKAANATNADIIVKADKPLVGTASAAAAAPPKGSRFPYVVGILIVLVILVLLYLWREKLFGTIVPGESTSSLTE